MRQIALTLAVLLAVSGATAAEPDRFRLERTPDGYVRMDTRTGEMSICQERWGELVCRLAADERTAMQDEMDRLRSDMEALEGRLAEVKALDERVARLENSLAARIEKTLPTEEDFNKTMSYMERFFRGFMAIVKDLENENAKPTEPGADRT
ncbi:MAG: hypothetical protein NTV73_01070 [Hyphomicrobiales bacterium]|nr:hypothetical protein [Hyphomicrobiales bacterium]